MLKDDILRPCSHFLRQFFMLEWKAFRYSVNRYRNMTKSCQIGSSLFTLFHLFKETLSTCCKKRWLAREKQKSVFSGQMTSYSFVLEDSLDVKNYCQFQGESWESKRSKYEYSLDIMLKQNLKDQEKYPNKEKLNKD